MGRSLPEELGFIPDQRMRKNPGGRDQGSASSGNQGRTKLWAEHLGGGDIPERGRLKVTPISGKFGLRHMESTSRRNVGKVADICVCVPPEFLC